MSGPGQYSPARASGGEQSGDGASIAGLEGGSSSRSGSIGAGDSHSGTPVSNSSSRTLSGRPKRTLIESACAACRRRKSRCDGVRPHCSRCQSLRTECQYEAEEGESRWSALRRRNQQLENERDQLKELLSFMQTGPELEALEIFNRMRQSSYDDLLSLLRQVKDRLPALPGASQLPILMPSVEQRLPPIQAMLEGPGLSRTPATLIQSHSLSSEDSRNSSILDYTPPHNSLRAPLGTLEPSLKHPPGLPNLPSLSSEESFSSLSSTSQDPRSHFTPP